MNSKIPEKGRPYDEILEELESFGADDPDYKNAKTWSLVYYLDDEYTQFLEKAYAKFFSANGLNPTAFRSLKRFEKEVVGFTAELFHVDEDACGVMTAGGTESCMLAVKTYRDWAREEKGIKKPEMVVPETAHVAWGKGAEYFGVKIRRAKLADDYRVDVNAVEKLINKNTIMILAGAPEYPHGMIDPVKELSEVALRHKIPLHVDACVGGYILPFIENSGIKLPLWDFRVPGVTSISADIHKYGFAAKGASCIIYRSINHFKHQVYVEHDWPGGVFASPALLGTRPGGAYAAAWAAIQANGMEGYTKLAQQTMDAVNRMKEGIKSIPELEIIGDPPASLISYRSVDSNVNIFAVGDVMQSKGWHVDRLQRPDALHAMVTAPHGKVVDQYINDIIDSVAYVKKHPELANQGEAATYGMIAHIPLKGMVRKSVLDMFSNSYKLSAKEIDLADSSALGAKADGSGDEDNKKQGLVDKIIAWYVKKASNKQK